MPPTVWCWPAIRRQILVVWRWRLKIPTNIPLHFVAMWQMAAEGQSGRMVSDVEAFMKQRCVTEFLHAEKMAPTDIHRHLWTFMDTKWWMWAQWGASRGIQQWQQWHERQVMLQTAMHSCHTMKWRAYQLAHPHELANSSDYVEKQCFVAEDLLYQLVLLCSLHLLQFPWK